MYFKSCNYIIPIHVYGIGRQLQSTASRALYIMQAHADIQIRARNIMEELGPDFTSGDLHESNSNDELEEAAKQICSWSREFRTKCSCLK